MTLPLSQNFPTVGEFETLDDAKKYLENLTISLNTMYEDMSANIDGFIRNDQEVDSSKWVPTISSTVTEDTITYNHRTGWSLRTGIITAIWFDIQWTEIGISSGNLYVNLPYKILISANMPFVGVVQYSGITLGGGYTNLVINGIPNTYRGEIWRTGTALTTTNLSIPNSGRIIAYLTYIGVQDE